MGLMLVQGARIRTEVGATLKAGGRVDVSTVVRPGLYGVRDRDECMTTVLPFQCNPSTS